MKNADRFDAACSAILSVSHEKEGIGTQGEKTLHAVFKRYYEPDPAFHEVKTGGFIADVRRDGRIVEIQTHGLYRMKKKLTAFLSDYDVTVVHPIPHTRTVRWIEGDGSFSPKRKSPKTGKYADAVSELLGIRDLLLHPRLSVVLSLCDCNDYKVRSGKVGRKRGAMRYERIPTALVSELRLSSPRDYLAFLPENKVTVVHPIPRARTVRWIEKDGSLSEKRKSPKTGKFTDAVSELLGIRDLLRDPHLTVVLSLVDCNDYKVRSGKVGRKRGAMRFERIPTALVSELRLSSPADYLAFLPPELPDVFTSADVARAGKLHRDDATSLLFLLYVVGVVDRIGKNEQRYYLYRRLL